MSTRKQPALIFLHYAAENHSMGCTHDFFATAKKNQGAGYLHVLAVLKLLHFLEFSLFF